MNDVVLPGAMVDRIAGATVMAARDLVETGGFILRGYNAAEASVLALTGEKGIERRIGLFVVSGLALAALFEWADEHDLTLAAQWHSHRFEAFLSETDLKYGFGVPGFKTAVVPWYEQASPNSADWGWWQYDGKAWVAQAAPATGAGRFTVVTFDEDGVR
jgi:hypothetical protein